MKRIGSVVFFGYGGKEMGMGHVVRIETLAKAFIEKCEGVEVTIVIPSYEEGVNHVYRTLGDSVNVVPVDTEYARAETIPDNFPQCDVAIFDCLNNPPSRLKAAKKKTSVVVTFDDTAEGVSETDIAFNPLYVPRVSIERDGVLMYDAPGYMPLREEFVAYRGRYHPERNVTAKRRVLILQGGIDTWNGMTRIVKKLSEVRNDIIAVPVIGKAYAHFAEMQKTIAAVNMEVELKQNVSNMADVMTQCDAAISACGLSIFELICIGIPSLTLTDEEKELYTAERLAQCGCVIDLGRLAELANDRLEEGLHSVLDNTEMRRELSARGMQEIDGNGAMKVLQAIILRYQEMVN
jgi:spore coat polysaccharide biosynthesis predicted glycosyltransferase SpsG